MACCFPSCLSWSSAPAIPIDVLAVPHSARRCCATPCKPAAVLHPFGLGRQLSITTLTSARQELQKPRATVLGYVLFFCPLVPTHRVTLLLFVRGQSALNTRWRCYQHYFCVYVSCFGPFSFRFCPPCDFLMTLPLALCECLWLLCIYAQMLSCYCFTLICCVCSQQTKKNKWEKAEAVVKMH